jgi:sugar phosphate isomerase/epimerase
MEFGLVPASGSVPRSAADLDPWFGAIAGAGFTAVSLDAGRLPDDLDRTGAALRRHGLRCTDLLSLRVTRDDEETLRAARALRPAVDALEADTVLTLVWTRVSEESLDRLHRVAEVLAVPLALEFCPGPLPTLEAALDVADRLGRDRASIVADTFHFLRGGSTWAMLESVPVDRVSIVQFDDALPAESSDYLDETVNRRTWPGDGEFDLGRFTQTLRRRGWDGLVSVEVLSDRLRELPVAAFAGLAHDRSLPYWE